jgi:hypothetical protein
MNDFLLPDFENERLNQLVPLAEFAVSRLVSLQTSLMTSTDTQERQDIVSQMTLSSAAIAVLTLAYLTERPALTEQAKTILKRIAP